MDNKEQALHWNSMPSGSGAHVRVACLLWWQAVAQGRLYCCSYSQRVLVRPFDAGGIHNMLLRTGWPVLEVFTNDDDEMMIHHVLSPAAIAWLKHPFARPPCIVLLHCRVAFCLGEMEEVQARAHLASLTAQVRRASTRSPRVPVRLFLFTVRNLHL